MSEIILTPKQQAAIKFVKERFHETTTLEEIYVAGWDNRDQVLAAIIWEDKVVDLTDPVEIALAAFTNGYARGLKVPDDKIAIIRKKALAIFNSTPDHGEAIGLFMELLK